MTPDQLRRFEDKYIPEPNSGCWLWLGATGGSTLKYGVFQAGGKLVLAHRWIYAETVGPIPHGLVIDHMCRVSLCVNPDHLRAVTQRVNVLSGLTKAAYFSKLTHCMNGHQFNLLNTIVNRKGHRHCQICKDGFYVKYKQSGLCTQCRKQPQRKGMTQCQPCADKHSAQYRARKLLA